MAIRRFLFLAMFGMLLASCEAMVRPATGWAAHEQAMLQLQRFTLEGRLGYRNGEGGVNANFVWTNDAEDFVLKLSGPFGAGAVQIRFKDGHLSLDNQQTENFTEWMSPAEVLYEHTGLQLPVNAFPYWVTGIPVPGLEYRSQLNEQQVLQTLEQDGWTLQYTRYAQVGKHLLPDRITLTRDDIRIRLVIDQWTL